MSEETTKFEPGDVVRLKSGGPWMTVTKQLGASAHVECKWFSPVNDRVPAMYGTELFTQPFPEVILEAMPPAMAA